MKNITFWAESTPYRKMLAIIELDKASSLYTQKKGYRIKDILYTMGSEFKDDYFSKGAYISLYDRELIKERRPVFKFIFEEISK